MYSEKLCTNCGKSGEYGVLRSSKDGLKSRCKPCLAAQQRAYVKKHPDSWAKYAAKNKEHLKQRDYDKYHSNPVKEKARVAKWKAKNPEKVACYSLRGMYGITLKDKQAMLAHQQGLCKACKDPLTTGRIGMQLDHDHKTGRIRGLLCRPCNVSLGYFKDRPESIHAALLYLKRGVAKLTPPLERPKGMKHSSREMNLWYIYGLTMEMFQELLDRQKGGCAICTLPLSNNGDARIDHDHRLTSKAVRGILCHDCNMAIGQAKESPVRLMSLVSYL